MIFTISVDLSRFESTETCAGQLQAMCVFGYDAVDRTGRALAVPDRVLVRVDRTCAARLCGPREAGDAATLLAACV